MLKAPESSGRATGLVLEGVRVRADDAFTAEDEATSVIMLHCKILREQEEKKERKGIHSKSSV